MKFEQKTIKRSIRNLERLIAELKSAGIFVYQSRVREFITLIKTDEVLIHIVKPYLDMDIDVEEIENEQYGWYNLKLPINKDYQISYVLKTMESSSAGQFAMDMYAHKIFRQKRIMDNIFEWNKQLLFPCLLILQDKLNDLVEDKVEGKEEIEAQSLQIINYGSITAKQGNIAMGKDISQTMTLKGISDEIIKKALERSIINEAQVEPVREITSEIETELQNENPDEGKLKGFVGKLMEMGKNGLVEVSKRVINDPRWTDAIVNFFIGG